MVYFIGELLREVYGPFRLLNSHLMLIVTGLFVAFFATLVLLPRSFRWLPYDRGREFAVHADIARGKPTGGGVVFITIFVLVSLLVVPFGFEQLAIIALVWGAMITGYLDDRSPKPWNEYLKGALDLALAFVASLVIAEMGTAVWLPFTKEVFAVPPALYVGVSTLVIWLSINTTNCSDGVDGLSSTLVLLALITLGALLYFVVGHGEIAGYLLVPHYPQAARWAIMIFVLVGSLAGYLWHNADPSRVLMGDAGSRALGFFLGVMVMNTGNPFVVVIVGSVLLVNGGAGLLKLALLRFFRIRVFRNVRFPLHDHFRKTANWSNAQVLVRFSLVQLLVMLVLIGIILKVR